MIGLVSAAALLLAAAGLAKLRQRAPLHSAFAAAKVPGLARVPAAAATRLAGAVELAIAALALALGGRLGALLIAVGFAALTGLTVRMVAIESGQDCGCFGRPSPVSHWHTGVNLAGLLIGLAALVLPADSLLSEIVRHPASGLPVALGAAVLAYLGYLTMTALPALRTAIAELETIR